MMRQMLEEMEIRVPGNACEGVSPGRSARSRYPVYLYCLYWGVMELAFL